MNWMTTTEGLCTITLSIGALGEETRFNVTHTETGTLLRSFDLNPKGAREAQRYAQEYVEKYPEGPHTWPVGNYTNDYVTIRVYASADPWQQKIATVEFSGGYKGTVQAADHHEFLDFRKVN